MTSTSELHGGARRRRSSGHRRRRRSTKAGKSHRRRRSLHGGASLRNAWRNLTKSLRKRSRSHKH